MKIAMQDGFILIKDASPRQFDVIKSWNKMRWVRSDQMLKGPADIELLDHLAKLIRLPPLMEAERQRMHGTADAVDRERLIERPVPLVHYPVKAKLFTHQLRAANMAMIVFGAVDGSKEAQPNADFTR